MGRRSLHPRAPTKTSPLLAASLLLLGNACGPVAPPSPGAPPPAARKPDSPAHSPANAPADVATNPPPTTPATVGVRGKLLDERGQPLRLATVELHSVALPEPLRIAPASDGGFEAAAPPGVVELTLAGADHLPRALTLVLDATDVEFTVQLATHTLTPPKAPAQLLLFRTPDADEPEAHDLKTDKAGRRSVTLDLPPGEYRYQLVGHVEGGRSTNGTSTTGYEYDGAGDYRSRLPAPGGPLTITFDPQQFPPSGQPGSLTFAAPDSLAARGAGLIARVRAVHDAHTARQLAAMELGEPEPTEIAGWDALRSELAAIARDDREPQMRHIAAILYFVRGSATSPEATLLATTALRDIAATDPLWSLAHPAFLHMLEVVPEPGAQQATIEAMLDKQRDPEPGAIYLLSKLEQSDAAGETAAVQTLYHRLQTPRFAATESAIFGRTYDPGRPLRPGKPMPALDLDLLAPPGKLDLAQFKGHPLLVDVWATWCKPCMAEMPELHKLFKRHGRGPNPVQFLSIAMDDPENVANFRRGKWSMPWQHAVVPSDRQDAVYAALGIVGIPATILLDADGKIVAATPDLELAELPERLAALTTRP